MLLPRGRFSRTFPKKPGRQMMLIHSALTVLRWGIVTMEIWLVRSKNDALLADTATLLHFFRIDFTWEDPMRRVSLGFHFIAGESTFRRLLRCHTLLLTVLFEFIDHFQAPVDPLLFFFFFQIVHRFVTPNYSCKIFWFCHSYAHEWPNIVNFLQSQRQWKLN